MPPKKTVKTRKDIKKDIEEGGAKKNEDDFDSETDSDFESDDSDDVDDADEMPIATGDGAEGDDEDNLDVPDAGSEKSGSENGNAEESDTESLSGSESSKSSVSSESEKEDNDDDEDCMYKYARKKGNDSDSDDERELVFDDDHTEPVNVYVKDDERITKPYLTKFERVRILGDRAKQIALGAKPMIKNVEKMNPKEIARMELERGIIPLIIERTLPNGNKERWRVSELTQLA